MAQPATTLPAIADRLERTRRTGYPDIGRPGGIVVGRIEEMRLLGYRHADGGVLVQELRKRSRTGLLCTDNGEIKRLQRSAASSVSTSCIE